MQLAEQQALDKAAIEHERAHGRAQLEEERRLALEREQYAQAYAVHVAFGDTAPDGWEWDEWGNRTAATMRKLAIMVVNRGSYTITRVEAQFCTGTNVMTPPHRTRRISGLANIPSDIGSPYAVVRWTDRWGVRWECKRGVVRIVGDGAPWER